MILIVDGETADASEHPMVRKRLGPQRIDLELRRHRAALARRFLCEQTRAGSECEAERCECEAGDKTGLPMQTVH